ncbi:Ras GTPase [Arachnomyces sp. PD_36]|nr:Ras GTPase [Arachnomyces sp. PD_36]
MQLCWPFFGKKKEMRRHHRRSQAQWVAPRKDRKASGYGKVYDYNTIIGGEVSTSTIRSFCRISPETHSERVGHLPDRFLEPPYRQQFRDDDGDGAVMEFMLTTDLWSTSAMALNWQRIADGLIIVFCIKKRESFDKLVDGSKSLLEMKEKKGIPLILVGSEPAYCDRISENTRQVTVEEAESFSRELGGEYFEIGSAKGVDNTPFRFLTEEIKKTRKSLSKDVSQAS